MKATKATSPNWAAILATCALGLGTVTALANEKPPGPGAEKSAGCPDVDPDPKKRPQIDINTASALDLRCAFGDISEAQALKIVANRRYCKVDDLLDKKLLNSGMFAKFQPRLTVSDPECPGKP